MVHAFFVSRWNAEDGSYLIDDPDGGTELWAYLHGSFLAHLKEQPLDNLLGDLAVHLDGAPVLREQFLDLDGDGLRRWHPLLVATGTMLQSRRSCLFVMDINDPYQPALLWERLLPGDGSGRTRGIDVDRCVATREPAGCLYLTADFAGGDDAPGIHALALADGQPYGEAPAYQVPGGAGVAVHGQVAIFGTSGVAGSDDSRQYAVYAVEIGPWESRLRWVYALAVGEKVWAPPLVDASGRLVLGTVVDYTSLAGVPEQAPSGRVVALDGEGTEELSRETAAAVVGGLVSAPGVAVAVILTGEETQFGSARRLTGPAGPTGSVRLLAWRER
jgi:hypothetical protein